MESIGEKPFRARQLWEWIYRSRVLEVDQMKTLPADLRRRLKNDFSFPEWTCLQQETDSAGTTKFLFQLSGGSRIESVVIPSARRLTVCVSSQAGCRFACRFCASGVGGLDRDLTCGEILMQILYAQARENRRVTHVVFMGTGEPLDNWPEVKKAIEVINAPEGMDIAARRITVSTCGIIPGMKKMADLGRQIELAVSLHGYNDEVRGRLMPVNRRYPFRDLIPASRDYAARTNRQVTFEYLLIDGLTCCPEAVPALGQALKGLLCQVNLIPYNPVKEFDWRPPPRKHVYAFRNALIAAGVHATVRWSKGQGAQGACGQLRAGKRQGDQ